MWRQSSTLLLPKHGCRGGSFLGCVVRWETVSVAATGEATTTTMPTRVDQSSNQIRSYEDVGLWFRDLYFQTSSQVLRYSNIGAHVACAHRAAGKHVPRFKTVSWAVGDFSWKERTAAATVKREDVGGSKKISCDRLKFLSPFPWLLRGQRLLSSLRNK